MYDPGKFEKVRNKNLPGVKPHGGLWLSPYKEKIGSPWLQFSYDGYPVFGLERCSLLKIMDKSRIFVIDKLDDLRTLILIHGMKDKLFQKYYLNFESISRYFDGIFLTRKGRCKTHVILDMERNKGSLYQFRPYVDLYGWDCESILILNPDIVEFVKEIELKKEWFKNEVKEMSIECPNCGNNYDLEVLDWNHAVNRDGKRIMLILCIECNKTFTEIEREPKNKDDD